MFLAASKTAAARHRCAGGCTNKASSRFENGIEIFDLGRRDSALKRLSTHGLQYSGCCRNEAAGREAESRQRLEASEVEVHVASTATSWITTGAHQSQCSHVLQWDD